MNEFLNALISQSFLYYALLAGLLASIACGLTGPYVVVKRISFLAGGISHSVLSGMGAAIFFGFDPVAGALAAAVVGAVLIGYISLQWRIHEDTLISALWAIGMASGILFMAKTPGYQTDLMSYLFGNILLVSAANLRFMLITDVILLLAITVWYRQFLAVVFDEEFARLRGVPVIFFYLLLLTLIAVTVVMLIQVVGLIMVLALLTLPAAMAAQYVRTLSRMMLLSILFGSLFTFFGLALSYSMDLPTGPTIILLAGGCYILSTLLSKIRFYRVA